MTDKKPINLKYFYLTLIGLVVITIASIFIYSPTADKLNSSSLTVVAKVTQVEGRWIYYKFYTNDQSFSSSFKVAKSHWDSLTVNDRIFVRFHPTDPTINFSLYPEHKVNNTLPVNSILDSLNTEQITWWWIANNPS